MREGCRPRTNVPPKNELVVYDDDDDVEEEESVKGDPKLTQPQRETETPVRQEGEMIEDSTVPPSREGLDATTTLPSLDDRLEDLVRHLRAALHSPAVRAIVFFVCTCEMQHPGPPEIQ